MTELKDFITMVENMRAAQKGFFSTHNSSFLQLSKELEKKVDNIIKDYKDKQTNLFEK